MSSKLIKANEFAVANKGYCLSFEIKTTESTVYWMCEKFHIFKRSLSESQRAKFFCRQCHTINSKKEYKPYADEIASKNNSVCHSASIPTKDMKAKWTCSLGHNFERSLERIEQNGTFCPKCSHDFVIYNQKNLGIEACHDMASSKNGLCLSDKYINTFYKYKWQCSEGHIWEASLNNCRKGHWCPYCKNKTENKVRAIFENLLGVEFPPTRFPWLIGAKGGRMSLDGYNDQLKLAFEYDGEYHFRPHYTNKDYKLETRQKNDELKNKLCKEQGIHIIRIDYTQKFQLEEVIQQKISEWKS